MNIAQQRLAPQFLLGNALPDPVDVVRQFCAVQAQDFHGAKWGVAQRACVADGSNSTGNVNSRRPTSDHIDQLFNDGAFLRTHVMRPTWHFIMPEDLLWMQSLTAERVQTQNGSQYRSSELETADFRKGMKIMEKGLRNETYLTRSELADLMNQNGLAAKGLRLTCLVMYAELEGLICSGPLRGKQFTYALTSERIKKSRQLDRDEAIAELLRRYISCHGPATEKDASWWTGLKLVDVRRGLSIIEREVESFVADDVRYYHNGTEPVQLTRPVVHLLPNFDELYVAYRDHSHTRPQHLHDRFKTRGAGTLDQHMIMVNGVMVGAWKRTIAGGVRSPHASIDMTIVEPMSDLESQMLSEQITSFGNFLGIPITVSTDSI